MMFTRPFVISSSPASDTVQTESMVTSIKNTKLFAIRQHFFKADAAFIIHYELLSIAILSCCHILRMVEFALLSISAIAFLKEFTHSKLFLIVQEVVNDVIIILHLLEFGIRNGIKQFVAFLHSNFLRNRIIRQ